MECCSKAERASPPRGQGISHCLYQDRQNPYSSKLFGEKHMLFEQAYASEKSHTLLRYHFEAKGIGKLPFKQKAMGLCALKPKGVRLFTHRGLRELL